MAWEPFEHVRIEGEFLTLAGGEIWDRVEDVAWQKQEREREQSAEKQREFRSRQHGRLYHSRSERERRQRNKEIVARVRACKQCGATFALTKAKVADIKKRVKHSGRFCSLRCFGRFNRARHNPRPARMVTIGKETRSLPEWAAHFGIGTSMVYRRIRKGMSDVEALTAPKTPGRRRSAGGRP